MLLYILCLRFFIKNVWIDLYYYKSSYRVNWVQKMLGKAHLYTLISHLSNLSGIVIKYQLIIVIKIIWNYTKDRVKISGRNFSSSHNGWVLHCHLQNINKKSWQGDNEFQKVPCHICFIENIFRGPWLN